MAQRRMFSMKVIDTDAFMDMPMSTQCLYFHLAMRADDDGFINNAKKIQRMVGASDDDMKLLLAKSFIIPFDSGVCVIRHWRIHNYIQKDRYTPTICTDECRQIATDGSNAYVRREALSAVNTDMSASVNSLVDAVNKSQNPAEHDVHRNVSRNGYMPDTQVRLGKSKVRLDEDRYRNDDDNDYNNIYNISSSPSLIHDDNEERPDYGTLEVYASSNLAVLTPTNMEELISWRESFTDDVIRYAIDEAAAHNARTWAFTRGILRNWLDAGVKTVGDAKAYVAKGRKGGRRYAEHRGNSDEQPQRVFNGERIY